MDEMDDLIDSLLQPKTTTEVNYIDDKYAKDIKVKDTPGKGQGIFAERALSVKDPICSLPYPTVMAIHSDFLPTTCYYCLVITQSPAPLPDHGPKLEPLKVCNGCQAVRFCGRDCQVKAWHAYHKYECKIFKSMRAELPPDLFRAVLRIVLLQDRSLLPADQWNRIISLDSHADIFTARGRSNLTDIAESIHRHTSSFSSSCMSVGQIQKLIFIMKSNATEIPTPIYGGIGVLLDAIIAKINHSCEPNISIHRPQHTMRSGWPSSTTISEHDRQTFAQVIPLRKIAKGEELLNCYVAPTVSISERKRTLAQDYCFDCTCSLCESDALAITALASSNPSLPKQFSQWTTSTQRALSTPSSKPSISLPKAAAAMEKSTQYLDHPSLITTGPYPEIVMALLFQALKSKAYDEALINGLRLYFLVNPERFVRRHNPTHIYTSFLLIDIFDAVLGVTVKDDSIVETLSKAESRGFTVQGLFHWRGRVCVDLRRRLGSSAAKDLLGLVEMREGRMKNVDSKREFIQGQEAKRKSEQEMRTLLGLSEDRWKVVLKQTGC